ncbi:MAG: MFS transporter [Ktedonobacteraceae bacterium]
MQPVQPEQPKTPVPITSSTAKSPDTFDKLEGNGVTPTFEDNRLPLWQRIRKRFSPDWVSRDMRLLLAARASMSAGRALAGIIVPIYLALIGYSALTLGELFVAVAITSAVLSGITGLLSDRFGRKPFIVVLPWFAALAAFVFAFSHIEAILFVFAAPGSFGRGAGAGAGMIGPYQPAEQAFLADTVPARHRNTLFGWIAFASSFGALIGTGPLTALPTALASIGLLNLQGLASYRLEFLIMAGTSLLAGLLALPITETRRTFPKVEPSSSTTTRRRFALRRPQLNISSQSWSILLRLWATNSVNGLAVGFFGPFITYWFFRRYGAGPVEIGLLFSLINLAAMVSNLWAATFAKRLGLVRAIVVSRVFQAVLIIPMVLAPTFWLAGAFYLVRMMAQRMGLPLRQSYVMGVLPPEERGTVGALANLPSQVTSAISPALAGYIFDSVSLALPFEIGAILQGLNVIMFFLFFRSLLPPEEQKE